jgi:hypothetical protein
MIGDASDNILVDAPDDISTSNSSTGNASYSSAMLAPHSRSNINIEEIGITNRVLRGQAAEMQQEGAEMLAAAGHASGGETAHHKLVL